MRHEWPVQQCSVKLCVPGDAVNGFRVAVGLLAYIHLHEAHPKAVHASDEVQQPPLCHNPATCSPQSIGTSCRDGCNAFCGRCSRLKQIGLNDLEMLLLSQFAFMGEAEQICIREQVQQEEWLHLPRM